MRNPFDDRSTSIILRARDMRPEAYAEQHIAAIDLLLHHAKLVGEGESLLLMARNTLRSDLSAFREITTSRNHEPNALDAAYDDLHWSLADAVSVIEQTTPEGWEYGADEDDPSYGGFYIIPEFYGACGVPECTDCLPRFDPDNNEIREGE